MRAVLVGVFSIVFTEAFLFGGLGCNVCGGGGYGGYGGAYSSYAPSYTSYSSYSSYAPQASYVQPHVAPHYDTLYAGRPYFTPVGAEGAYPSFPSYSSMTPTYNQILPLPANAQIVSGYPTSPVNTGYSPVAQPSYPIGGGYATGPSYQPPQVSQPIEIPVQKPVYNPAPAPVYEPAAPVREVHDGYIQPAASVQPYTPVRHATVEEAAPAEKPSYRETVIVTQPVEEPVVQKPVYHPQVVEHTVEVAAPAKPTYTQPAAPVLREKVEVPITKMINTPEEAGYRN